MENTEVSWSKPLAHAGTSKYVQESVSNSEAYLHENFGGRKFSKKVINPFEWEYDTLVDYSDELVSTLLNYYQTQIGVLICMAELGRIDIITEVSMLASQLALPWEGYLEAVSQIFGYM